MSHAWFYWALASALFAALTAIFAKAGLQGIDSDFATFIRTLVIVAALVVFLTSLVICSLWLCFNIVSQLNSTTVLLALAQRERSAIYQNDGRLKICFSDGLDDAATVCVFLLMMAGRRTERRFGQPDNGNHRNE